MMLFSMFLATSDIVYDAQGLFVCFCHGIYISSLTQGVKMTSCASTEDSAVTQSLERHTGRFAAVHFIRRVWSTWSSGQSNCPSAEAPRFKVWSWQEPTMLKWP